ncbi:MAG: histone H1 [Bacteroidota bacterium]
MSDTQNYIKQIEELVANLKVDYAKFEESNNKTAGTRSRNYLQQLKKLSQELRMHIQETKNKQSNT